MTIELTLAQPRIEQQLLDNNRHLMLNFLFLLTVIALAVVAVFAIAKTLLNRSYNRRTQSHRECLAGLQRLGLRSMDEYRKSQLWLDTKRRYQQSDSPQRCLVCRSPAFDLHHRSYAQLGNEHLFDLIPLCRQHHDAVHALLDRHPGASVKETYDYLPLLMPDSVQSLPGDSVLAPATTPPRTASRKARPQPAVPLRKRRPNRTNAGKQWAPQEDAALLKAFHARLPLQAIADQLGRGLRAVEVRLFKLGQYLPD